MGWSRTQNTRNKLSGAIRKSVAAWFCAAQPRCWPDYLQVPWENSLLLDGIRQIAKIRIFSRDNLLRSTWQVIVWWEARQYHTTCSLVEWGQLQGHVPGHSHFMRTLSGRTNRASIFAISCNSCCYHLRGDGKCLLHGRMGRRTHCSKGMARGRKVFWENLFYSWVGFLYVVNPITWGFNRLCRHYSFVASCLRREARTSLQGHLGRRLPKSLAVCETSLQYSFSSLWGLRASC